MKRLLDKIKTTPKIKRALVRLALTCLALAPVVVAFFIIMHRLGLDNISREQIQEIVDSSGAFAPLVFIFITFLQVSFIPIPSAPVILGGSYIFGVFESFFYSYIGTLLGASVAFLLGRKVGRPFINWVAGDKETVDSLFKRLHGREKVVLFAMFLLPMFPDDLLCSVAGMLPMTFGLFFLMQITTRTVAIGGTLLLFSGDILPFHGWGLWAIGGIIAAIVIIFVVLFVILRKRHKNANNNLQNHTTADKSSEKSDRDSSLD